MRVAIYFVPGSDTRLWRDGCAWLGRDAGSGRVLDQVAAFPHPAPARGDADQVAGLPRTALTEAPRRYGFHATLKAPFRLAGGVPLDTIASALARFCTRRTAAHIRLKVELIGNFVALVAEQACPEIDILAGAAVVCFERFRAPLDETELSRRGTGLTQRQRELLAAWGYPYVLDEFRFHMSLTGPVAPLRAIAVRDALADRFAGALRAPVAVDRLALCVEPAAGAPLHIHSVFRLTGAQTGDARPAAMARG